MATGGLSDYNDEWLFASGIPAKTGVSGGIMGVLPGMLGIAAFAPPLDSNRCSVKAQAAIKFIMEKSGLNVFCDTGIALEKPEFSEGFSTIYTVKSNGKIEIQKEAMK